MSKTEYEKGFCNGFKACTNKLNGKLNNYSCRKCVHAKVCSYRAALILSFGSIIIRDNSDGKQAEYMIAIVCQYYKQKERSD